MIAYISLAIGALVAAFVAGAYYGRAWEQKAIADIVSFEQYGHDELSHAVQYVRNRVAKYL